MNRIAGGKLPVDFVVANTDAQALTMSKAARTIQMGIRVTQGLGAGSQPEVGRAAAEEVIEEIRDHWISNILGSEDWITSPQNSITLS
jgi:cell division protein FtsZ